MATVQESKVYPTGKHAFPATRSSTRTNTHPANHPPTHIHTTAVINKNIIAGPIHTIQS